MQQQEKEIGSTFTLINIQGELNKKYKIGFFFDFKPKRATAAEGWPSSPEENLERLKDAGLPYERGVPKCNRCNGKRHAFRNYEAYLIYAELGHTTRSCPEEAGEIDRVSVKCVNCDEPGHRARDCTKERYDRFACRNCKYVEDRPRKNDPELTTTRKSGHQAPECPEPRSAEGVECKRCNESEYTPCCVAGACTDVFQWVTSPKTAPTLAMHAATAARTGIRAASATSRRTLQCPNAVTAIRWVTSAKTAPNQKTGPRSSATTAVRWGIPSSAASSQLQERAMVATVKTPGVTPVRPAVGGIRRLQRSLLETGMLDLQRSAPGKGSVKARLRNMSLLICKSPTKSARCEDS